MKTKILMVCLGNICRSPLAEGILKSKLDQKLFVVDSAGTGGWHQGEKPDSRSIKIAKKYGIDISSQKARQITLSDFTDFDYIYVMDKENYKNVITLTNNEEHKSKVKLIMNELEPDKNIEVPDPYYGGEDGFENVFKMLNKTCEIIKDKLIKKATK